MKKRLIVISMIAMFVVLNIAGCNESYLVPNVKAEVYLAEAFVTEMNERCQAGDPNACSAGLDRASKILTLIVDALEGKGSD